MSARVNSHICEVLLRRLPAVALRDQVACWARAPPEPTSSSYAPVGTPSSHPCERVGTGRNVPLEGVGAHLCAWARRCGGCRRRECCMCGAVGIAGGERLDSRQELKCAVTEAAISR